MKRKQELTEKELFLFNQGTFCRCYKKFGAHFSRDNDVPGVAFSVWAPLVKSVRVVGSFNGWQADRHFMSPLGSSGVWSVFIPGVKEGEQYKYLIEPQDGNMYYKADPFAFSAEVRPGTASLVTDISGYRWHDKKWLSNRNQQSHFERPMNIYEVHLGSWKQHALSEKPEVNNDADRFYSYRELAKTLVPYVKEMGYTHIEILPVMEHPFDGSWGYQVTGYYAPTSRYGAPKDFMYFIDACHRAELGVILDWVPGHFCRDAHGLGRFTGEKLYEIEDNEEWGTYKFDLGRREVRSFLISNAVYWLDKYHIDGLRVDGVSSMLYLNYGISDRSKHRFNSEGGESNLEAVSFLQDFNRAVGKFYPGVFTMAEESTAWPLVTRPPDGGGLGFHYKWDMGWMNDTLKFMSLDFGARGQAHKLLTFSMMYAFSENFVLPLSHDEVVHGKRSLIGRMPGDYMQQFAGTRLLALYQFCHPGFKLNFMGGEIAQFIEWRYYEGLEWFLLKYEQHLKHQAFIKALNKLYKQEPSLWEINFDWSGYGWLDADNNKQSILIFKRMAKADGDFTIAVLNFKTSSYSGYRVGVPRSGNYMEAFNSDREEFGGSGKTNPGLIKAEKKQMHGQEFSVEINVPPLGGLIIKPDGAEEKPD